MPEKGVGSNQFFILYGGSPPSYSAAIALFEGYSAAIALKEGYRGWY
jgi:hypothetical protein